MRLIITTPLEVIIDHQNVTYVRAEDDSGSFGIMKGHADFLTALKPTVITWRRGTNAINHYAALRGGMLNVEHGYLIQIASREAVASDNLNDLEHHALAKYQEEEHIEEISRSEARRMHMNVIRQIVHNLHPGEDGPHRHVLRDRSESLRGGS